MANEARPATTGPVGFVLVMALLGGGGVGVLGNRAIDRQPSERIATIETRMDEYQRRIKKLERQFEGCRDRAYGLESRLANCEQALETR